MIIKNNISADGNLKMNGGIVPHQLLDRTSLSVSEVVAGKKTVAYASLKW